MKFLQAVTLSAILVGYATASDDSGAQFYYAVKKGRLATAVELYEQDKSLGKLGIDYVVKKAIPSLSPISSTKLGKQMTVHLVSFATKNQ